LFGAHPGNDLNRNENALLSNALSRALLLYTAFSRVTLRSRTLGPPHIHSRNCSLYFLSHFTLSADALALTRAKHTLHSAGTPTRIPSHRAPSRVLLTEALLGTTTLPRTLTSSHSHAAWHPRQKKTHSCETLSQERTLLIIKHGLSFRRAHLRKSTSPMRRSHTYSSEALSHKKHSLTTLGILLPRTLLTPSHSQTTHFQRFKTHAHSRISHSQIPHYSPSHSLSPTLSQRPLSRTSRTHSHAHLAHALRAL
jgi:hypothetical protein